ncbi:SNF2-related protein [Rosistilla oblonga]|uniref:SNF2-related protein n=1 Tax=Rosistilla oblonga TaxID=2527990 RepID=UPI003A9861C0
MTTPYHSQYFAHELTKRLASDNAEKLSQSLLSATVDLNPHQIDAALFAFRSPLSRGAVLADEVGLGKTIEAGLILSQIWAERKRRSLCIVPASLRKQWSRELLEKFHIPSEILESKSYMAYRKQHDSNPFEQEGQVLICSYQFARSKIQDVQVVPWDLVILDEAHRIRNVYKKSNKIAREIRDGILPCPKVLLTATPLQNSLMELYGLISFVDPHLFGDEDSFRSQFAPRPGAATTVQLQDLRSRIRPVCQRTLRRQVMEYVPYTNRISVTQDFTPTTDEAQLYEAVSNYLQKDELLALPTGQRQLITLILRKILASSSFAITATLGKLIDRLEGVKSDIEAVQSDDMTHVVAGDFEITDELQEEWKSDTEDDSSGRSVDPETQKHLLSTIKGEIAELKSYKELADSIVVNAKGEALLGGLKVGFKKADELGSPRKVLIFTESRRTQTYLKSLLEENGYARQVVTVNGTNTAPESKQIYTEWLKRHEGEDCITGSPTADSRAALVEHFRDHASVMIATESAAEGVNLQFCNVVVNYDLPWNPQRIEQRIGRCHRYGQKFDVIVINFLNRKNEADQRVFELLDQKFRLFDGVFGASDEVLGALESGVDFERRILEIHQRCRTTEEIKNAFDDLQKELEDEIANRMEQARTTLMEHFDEEVHEKLRIRQQETEKHVSRYERWLWQLVKTELMDVADFDDDNHRFRLTHRLPGMNESIPLGTYGLVIHKDGHSEHHAQHHLRFDAPLVTFAVEAAKQRKLAACEMTFDHSNHPFKVSLAEKHTGRSGWFRVSHISVTALEEEQHLVLSGLDDSGNSLPSEECAALFSVPGKSGQAVAVPDTVITQLDQQFEVEQRRLIAANDERNLRYFADEEEKLDRWAEDLKEALERELKEIAADIRAIKKESRIAATLDLKLTLQKQVKAAEKKQSEKRKRLFDAQDEVDKKRDRLIAETQSRLKQSISVRHLFTIKWGVV